MKASRKRLLVANWKMNKTSSEARSFAQDLVASIGQQRDVHVVICPPFTALSAVSEAIEGSAVLLGAQNMHPERAGAFTGEVSADMLRELFVNYVLIGHSERRQLLGENGGFIHQKILAALRNQLKPILCIGETLEEHQSGDAKMVLQRQLEEALDGVTEKQAECLHIAYEPIWAIGTGQTATPQVAQEVQGFVREWVKGQFGEATADKIRLLYGGSMNADNAAELLAQPDIDGGLIGSASLEARSFLKLAEIAMQESLT
jgi:triosephosphate isomerase